MKHCKTCGHWDKKSFEELHPEYDKQDLATYQWYPSTARYCKHPDLYESCNREFGDGEIITVPNFGCILHKEK